VNTRYLEDEDLDSPTREREISLGATTILGIFLLLALVCAVFFGFGYSMGRRSSLSATPAPDSASAAVKTTGATKPTPGLTPSSSLSVDAAETSSSDDTASAGPQLPQPTQPPADAPPSQKSQDATAPVARPVADSPQVSPPAVSKAIPQPALRPAAAAAPGVPALVQVAAVSHQEDADMLLNALKRRGYDVIIRHEPQDKLLHIQLGPFPTRKDADAMRQRLLADGYNAIVK
jgi:DedD protein